VWLRRRHVRLTAVIVSTDVRAFNLLWAGQAVSQFGTLTGRAALSFAAISTLGATPYDLVALGTVEHVSAIAGAALATAVTDRLRRRPVMIAADVARAALTLAIPVLAFTGTLDFVHLVAVAALVGALSVIFDVACSAYVPSVVPADGLVAANARLSASSSVAEIAGFGIAGWLVQWLTAPIAIAVDGLSFVVSAISLWAIREPEALPQPRTDLGDVVAAGPGQIGRVRRAAGTYLDDARAGVTTILALPVLGGIVVALFLDALGTGIGSVTIGLYMIRGVGFEPGYLTMIWAVGGVSSLGAAAVARRFVTRFGAGPAMTWGLAGTGIGTILIAGATGPDFAGAAFLVANQIVTDPFATVWMVTSDSTRQSVVPNALMGRVGSAIKLGSSVVNVAGLALGGVIVEAFGMRAGVVAGGVAFLAAAALLAFTPAGRVGPVTIEEV
jgi:MFS family permease